MDCDRLASWMDGEGPRGGPSPGDDGHAETCPECGVVQATYAAGVRALREVASAAPPGVPDSAVLAAALDERLHPVACRLRWMGWLVPVPVAVVAALVVLWPGTAPDPLGVPPPLGGVDGPVLTGDAGWILPEAPGAGPIAAPAPVRAGQRVEAAGGPATVEDARVATVALEPATRMRLMAWGTDDTVLALESGRLDAAVRPRSAGERFEIQTEFAVIRVVGTRFTVEHRPGVDTTVTVLEGTVGVDSRAGLALAVLPAGGSLRVGPGGVHGPAARDDCPSPDPEASPSTDVAQGRSSPAVASRRPDPSPLLASVRQLPATSPPVQAIAEPPAASGPSGNLAARARRLALEGRGADALAMIRADLASATTADRRSRLLAVLGDLHRVSGRPDEAREAYEAALESAGDRPPEGLLVDLATLLRDRLEQPDLATAVWRRYLDAWPKGRFATRALGALWQAEVRAGRRPEAEVLAMRLLESASASPEAVEALAGTGRGRLEARDLSGAEAWFAARVEAREPVLAEAALVGLMRVRLEQGRFGDVRALGREHLQRFPEGTRRDEVDRLLAVAEGQAPGRP